MSDAHGKYSVGEMIDERYRVRRLLGHGGMAEVYLVEDGEMHGRLLALKLLYPHISLDPINVERFIREVELTQNLQHPNIVKSFHYKKSQKGEQYFTLEYVEGRSLAEMLTDRSFSPTEIVRYLLQILSALSAAHAAGVIHRDIKPENIILSSDNVIKITDFGIAKDLKSDLTLTEPEKGPKSYLYKAPELYVDKYDGRVDLYSLGITTYQLLTGETPFSGDKNQLLMAHLRQPLPRLSEKRKELPKFFQKFVDLCSAKNVDDRFGSADEAAKFLRSNAKELLGAGDWLPRQDGTGNSQRGRYIRRTLRRTGTLLGKKYVFSLAVGLVAVLLFLPSNLLGGAIIGDSLDLHLLDLEFHLRAPLPVPENILLISIDEESFEHFGLSTLEPWPRELFAEFLERLSEENPRLIVFDFRFSKISDPRLADPERDRRLAAAFKKTPSVISKFLDVRRNSAGAQLSYDDSDEIFLQNVQSVFFANLVESRGVVRNFNTGLGTTDGIPAVSELFFGHSPPAERIPAPNDLINYYGIPGTITHIPFYRAFDRKELPEGYFRNKIVFVGMQLFVGYGVTQRDTFITPASARPMAGVEIHATSAANVLEKNWLKRLPLFNEALVIFVIQVFFSYILFSVSPRTGLVIGLTTLFLWLPATYALLLQYLFFPGLLVPLTLCFVAYPLSILRVYEENRRAERVLGISERS